MATLTQHTPLSSLEFRVCTVHTDDKRFVCSGFWSKALFLFSYWCNVQYSTQQNYFRSKSLIFFFSRNAHKHWPRHICIAHFIYICWYGHAFACVILRYFSLLSPVFPFLFLVHLFGCLRFLRFYFNFFFSFFLLFLLSVYPVVTVNRCCALS